MQIQYALDERPPAWKSVLFGLQWAAIAVPSVITVGRAIDSLHGTESPSAPGYLQRLLLVTAITLVGQVLVGHRLPVIAGPATVLLIGVLGSGSSKAPLAAECVDPERVKATVSRSGQAGGMPMSIFPWLWERLSCTLGNQLEPPSRDMRGRTFQPSHSRSKLPSISTIWAIRDDRVFVQ